MKISLFILFFSFFSCLCFGQTDSLYNQNFSSRDNIRTRKMEKFLTLITGYQIQKNKFAEVGVGIMNDGFEYHHPSTFIFGLSNELKLSDDFIWGLKLGAWAGGGAGAINIGLNLIHYTDFKESSFQFRPEIGIGYSKLRMVYGYNFSITNKDFEGINKHNFGFNYMIKLKKLEGKKTD